MECSARWSFIERDGARSSWSRIKALVISSGADFPELTMPVMSIRLEEKDLERIKSLASSDNKDQSTVARELHLLCVELSDGTPLCGRKTIP